MSTGEPLHPESLKNFIDIHDRVLITVWDDAGNASEYPTYIKDVMDARIIVDVQSEDIDAELLQSDRKIGVQLQNIPMIYGRIMAYDAEHVKGVWIQLPSNIRQLFIQQREHVRVSIHFPLTVVLPSGKATPGQCVNIGGGGMRFVCSEPLGQGDAIRLQFCPDEKGPSFDVRAEVVMAKVSPYKMTQLSYRFMQAVKFLDMPRADQDRLVGICFRLELQNKKHLR